MNAVIADFGLARMNTKTKTISTFGTYGFIAPEILMKQDYSQKADVSINSSLQLIATGELTHRLQ